MMLLTTLINRRNLKLELRRSKRSRPRRAAVGG